MNENKMEIPVEIIGLCCLFWIVPITDEWDKTLCDHKCIDIDGSCIRLKNKMYHGNNTLFTLFGSQIVSNGVFKWRLKLRSSINPGCIGIIKNDQEYLQKNKHDTDYALNEGCCFFFKDERGFFIHHERVNYHYYSNPCKQGSMIEMTLDMDNHTIQYTIDDNACDTVKIDSLMNKEYRLAVTIKQKGNVIELL